jgi:hypothetical protein
MNRSPLSLASPAALTLAVLSLSALPACGSKGDDDDSGTGGTGGTMSGVGGTTSVGGSSGSAGTMARPEPTFDFDTEEQGWKPLYISLGKDDAMMDVPSIDLTDVKTKWADGVGDGDDGGALQGDIPYTSPRQYVGIGINLSFEDFTDKLITMRVKIKSGVVSDADIAAKTPGAKIYVKTGDQYVYAAGVYQSITSHDTWYTLKMNLADSSSWSYVDKGTDDAPKTFDPSAVGELGVQFDSPGDLTAAVTDGVVLVDKVTY